MVSSTATCTAKGGRLLLVPEAETLVLQVLEGLTSKLPSGQTLRVREVWQDNLDDELEAIRSIVDEYPFIAMDTEFPGVVARPVGNFKSSGEFIYQTLRCVHLEQLESLKELAFQLVRPTTCPPQAIDCNPACRCNVDMLKLIQLGLTFTDKDGNLPHCGGELAVWQFNFRCCACAGDSLAKLGKLMH